MESLHNPTTEAPNQEKIDVMNGTESEKTTNNFGDSHLNIPALSNEKLF